MRRPPRPSRLEDLLVAQLALTALPPPVRELRFAPPRRWRADLAWPAARVIVEVDGAVFVRGRHTRGTGFMRDCEKLNAAVLAGWRVLRVTRPHILRGQAVQWITQALAAGPAHTHPAHSSGAPPGDPPMRPPRIARATSDVPPGMTLRADPHASHEVDDRVTLTRDVVRSMCASGLQVRASRRGGAR